MINFFRYYRNGFSLWRSFDLAYGKGRLIIWLQDTIKIAIVTVAVLGLVQFIDDQVNTKVSEYKGYTTSLEKVVAKCLQGGAVTVGREVYLCSTYNTGEKI